MLKDKISSIYDQVISHHTSGYVTQPVFDKEKFARLIIEEACKIVEENINPSWQLNYLGGWKDAIMSFRTTFVEKGL
jgi:hypothetical protein